MARLKVDRARIAAALDIPGAWAWINGDVVTAGPCEEYEAQRELCRLEGTRFLELGSLAELTRDWWLGIEAQRQFLPAALLKQAEALLREWTATNLNIIEVDF